MCLKEILAVVFETVVTIPKCIVKTVINGLVTFGNVYAYLMLFVIIINKKGNHLFQEKCKHKKPNAEQCRNILVTYE